MTYKDLRIGDLVKLKDDLIDDEYYEGFCYHDYMKLDGYKPVNKISNNYFIIKGCDYAYTLEMIDEIKRPCQYKTIYKYRKPILDNQEKEYLGNVIKPFRDKKHITLEKCSKNTESEYIFISLYNKDYLFTCITFPCFKKNTMYKGMKLNKEYSLKELGL